MNLDKETLTDILTDLSNMIELNIFTNLKIFLNEVMPKAKTNEEKILLLKYWVDMIIEELERKTNKEKLKNEN